MKTTIRLFSIVLAFLSITISPRARATCQDACLANDNTVQGDDALISLTSGTDNTAFGFDALLSNTTGNNNTATGSSALHGDTTGFSNTANGSQALFSNTTGWGNTAIGASALVGNTTGIENTAVGLDALNAGNGFNNTAIGASALIFNTGNSNTATGFAALSSKTNAGSFNTANGVVALASNNTGADNTAIGYEALYHNSTGSNNIALGFQAGARLTTGSDNIYIGNTGKTAESGAIRIGTVGTHANAYIAGVSGVTVANGVGVIIDTNGHLGTVVSSERFKEAIKPMDKASEAILALKPVTFRYKHDLDPKGIPQFGLVAEQVEKVNPDLVARDDEGKPYIVRYEAVNAMLLNEFLKEHRKVEKQEATIGRLEKQVEALTAGLQKLSVQLELSKPATQTALNNQ